MDVLFDLLDKEEAFGKKRSEGEETGQEEVALVDKRLFGFKNLKDLKNQAQKEWNGIKKYGKNILNAIKKKPSKKRSEGENSLYL